MNNFFGTNEQLLLLTTSDHFEGKWDWREGGRGKEEGGGGTETDREREPEYGCLGLEIRD